MRYLKFLLVVLLLGSCQEEKDKITRLEEYNSFLDPEPVLTTSKYFELWNSKINTDSTQVLSLGNVAAEYDRYFKNTGDIKFLKKAEKALTKAYETANVGKVNYARALARNYISQHRFKEALELAKIAEHLGGGKKDTQALLFDIHMELGNDQLAVNYLDSIKNMSHFGYLIRLAKWNDSKGNLETTIKYMELALQRALSSKNKNLLIWSYTNLADYYGHAGRIEDSYKSYLNALTWDKNNAYAKKGIAWIVYSHERNAKEALRILNSIAQTHRAPDYHLLMAEIQEFVGNKEAAKTQRQLYFELTSDPSYGLMYHSHTVDYYLEFQIDYEKAMELAMKEINSRPTPESYHLLAKTYLKMNNLDAALDIVNSEILGKTFEPRILLTAAQIFKTNHDLEMVSFLKEELESATYELGPNAQDLINML